MNRILVFCLLLLFLQPGILFAQASGERPKDGDAGRVQGKVTDKKSGESVPFASVTLHKASDSVLVNGVLTGEKGDFSISGIAPGTYTLRVNCIGFKRYKTGEFTLSASSPVTVFKKIEIEADINTLDEVSVTGRKSDLQLEMDRKVYNVENNLTVAGGSAADVLKQVPSIGVDLDGNVTLRGSENVMVYIDGKPSAMVAMNPAMALEQIPAASIERVEVITNPSAKFDAEGMSGIINIVLKKNASPGVNGSATAGAGTGDKYNGGMSLNFQDKKVNLFGNYNYRNQQREITGDSWRNTFFPDTSFTFAQESNQKNHNINHSLRLGGELSLSEGRSLGASATLNKSSREESETIRNREYDENGLQTRLYDRMSNGDDSNKSMDLLANYRKVFADPQHLFSIDASYSAGESDNTRNFSDVEFIDEHTPAPVPADLQNTYDQNKTRVASLQSDYAQPFREGKDKLESGLKFTGRDIESGFASESFDNGNDVWIVDTLLENNFNYSEDIYAGYVGYASELKSVKIKAGLRAEYTDYQIDQLTQVSSYANDYLKLFPSVFISRTVAPETDVQVSYSKRINRPSLNALNPIADYSDPLNIRQGNPYLAPELIHSFELSSIRYRDAWVLSGTLYYRYIVDQIQRYRTVDSNGVSTMTQVNLDNGSSAGAEASARWQMSKALDATLSGNLYQTRMNGGNLEEGLERSTLGGSAKLLFNARMAKDFSVQMTGDYNSGWASVMGTMKPNLSFDIGLRKDLFKKQLSLNLTCTDIFDARKMSMDQEGSNYVSTFTRKRESRVLTLNATWKFGRQAESQGNRKKQRENQQQQQPDMQDEF